MSTRAEQVEALTRFGDNDDLVCLLGEVGAQKIRHAAATLTRDGFLREKLKKLVEEWRDKRRVEFEMKLDGFVAATDALMDCADGVKALMEETSDEQA